MKDSHPQTFGKGATNLVKKNIWERGNKFGEKEYVYPLLLISKPYFACDLSLMIKSERLL
jgi:hypothetical protein